VRIQLLKKLDALLGPVVCRLLPLHRADGVIDAPASILLIRPGGIGDAVLLVPAILALKKRFPACRVDVLAERRNAGAFALCPQLGEVLHYDRPRELVRVLRRRYDLVIDTEQWHRLSAVVARLIRSRLKIGFGTNERRRMFDYGIAYRQDRYEVDSFLDLLVPLGIAPEPVEAPFLTVPETAQQEAARLLAPLDGQPFVVLFPGASIAERRWGGTRFRELAKAIVRQGKAVIVVGGPEDRAAGDVIVEGLAPALNLAGWTSLAGTAAVLSRAQLLVSGDSGVLHMAVGLGVPTVSLFGPGIVEKWAPRGDGHVVIRRHLDCSPCTRFGNTPPCPVGGACIREIAVADVWDEVASLVAR